MYKELSTDNIETKLTRLGTLLTDIYSCDMSGSSYKKQQKFDGIKKTYID